MSDRSALIADLEDLHVAPSWRQKLAVKEAAELIRADGESIAASQCALQDAQRENEQLRARLSEAEKDAARYRWIRDRAEQWEWPGTNLHVGDDGLPVFQSNLRLKVWTGIDVAVEFHGTGLDLQIDDAIKWEYGAALNPTAAEKAHE